MRRMGLSEQVLARQAKRREKIRARWLFVTFLGIGICIQICIAYDNHRRRMLIDAPTWATFTTLGPSMEFANSNPSKVPNGLTINGERWSVIEVHSFPNKGDEMTAATTYCEWKTIAFIPDSSVEQQKIDIMHEVFHAGACLHGGDEWWNSEHPTRTEHIGIYHLADFMSTFLRDNPTFADWMAH